MTTQGLPEPTISYLVFSPSVQTTQGVWCSSKIIQVTVRIVRRVCTINIILGIHEYIGEGSLN
jgi:hypothetical protein